MTIAINHSDSRELWSSSIEISENARGYAVRRRLISQKRVASYHRTTLRWYRRNIAEAINLSCSQDDAMSRRFCSPVRVMIRGTRDNPPLLRVLQATLYGLVTSIGRIDDPEILSRNITCFSWIFNGKKKFTRVSYKANPKRRLFLFVFSEIL